MPRRARTAGAPDAGSVTAELALALPGLVLVLVVAVSALGAAAAQLRCVDAARDVARELARGEAPARATSVAAQVAPGARVGTRAEGGLVRVVVTDRVRIGAGPLGVTVDLRGEAVARPEPAPATGPPTAPDAAAPRTAP
ncbi:pilus assembly protein [Vallicoccus soli]|uniref:Pilus assembly protein n=1 Tax=Vallicoccus soli TaxID=2339232 RepID=A0A3A3ZNC6_9ACTN|nr:pilus assembly protein [Vallicoccus soli]